jgi:hypothetical protein
MRLLTIRRRGSAEPARADTGADLGVSGEPTGQQGGAKPRWTGSAAATTRAMTAALWCLLAAGPVALGLQVATPPPPSAPVPRADTGDSVASERAAAGAFAQDFVTVWLSTARGRENALGAFGVDAAGVTLPERPWTVSDATTSRITRVEDHLWSVTVSVTVAVTVAGTGSEPGVRRYFQVPVLCAAGGAVRAQALPSPVAGPAVADPVPLGYRHRAVPTEPVAAAAGEFLTALLTGSGDVARYVSPGAPVTAVTPPPYRSVEIEEVLVDREPPAGGVAPDNGEEHHLLVTAAATAGEGQIVTVQYALTVAARDGRWEVQAIDPAPVVSTTSASPSPGQASGFPAPPEPVTTPGATN